MEERTASERDEMVRCQIENRGVRNPAVLTAMRKVERHRLLSESMQGAAYVDSPLPIGMGQTISQPYIVALMTELLMPGPEDIIMEVGTGSGYQAAVLAEIVKEVYTVEIIEELYDSASRKLQEIGYDNIHCLRGDGGEGWPEHAPYDGIIITAAAKRIPKALIEQLKIGGRMVLPLGRANLVQTLTVGTRTDDGLELESGIGVRFVPMTGASQRSFFRF
jgi:protein-L-isoaspartate(D-aspartate) O-methyltransferase